MSKYLKENIKLAYEEIFPFTMKESTYQKIVPFIKSNFDDRDPVNSLTKIIIAASTGRNNKKAFLHLENYQGYSYKNKLSYYEDIVKKLNEMLYIGYTYKQAMNKILDSIPEEEAHNFSLWHDYKYGRDRAMYKQLATTELNKQASFANDNSGSLWISENNQHSLISNDSANRPSNPGGGESVDVAAKAKSDRISLIRNKMLSRVRSLENLLENNLHLLNEDIVGKIESTINALKSHVRNIKHAQSAVDCLIKHANLLKKQNWEQGAYHLIALADELDNKVPQQSPTAAAAPPIADASSVNDTNEPASDILGKPKKSPFTASELESMLNQLTDLSIALKRRDLVREIASIDIALHNNNMAAFFPEISDALSRLIDAYSYSSNKIESSLQKLRSASSNQLSEEEEVRMQRQTNKEVANQLAASPAPPQQQTNQTQLPPQTNQNIKS